MDHSLQFYIVTNISSVANFIDSSLQFGQNDLWSPLLLRGTWIHVVVLCKL